MAPHSIAGADISARRLATRCRGPRGPRLVLVPRRIIPAAEPWVVGNFIRKDPALFQAVVHAIVTVGNEWEPHSRVDLPRVLATPADAFLLSVAVLDRVAGGVTRAVVDASLEARHWAIVAFRVSSRS